MYDRLEEVNIQDDFKASRANSAGPEDGRDTGKGKLKMDSERTPVSRTCVAVPCHQLKQQPDIQRLVLTLRCWRTSPVSLAFARRDGERG